MTRRSRPEMVENGVVPIGRITCDEEDRTLVANSKWVWNGHNIFRHGQGRKVEFLRNLICPPPPNHTTVHANGDRFDVRRSNLVFAGKRRPPGLKYDPEDAELVEGSNWCLTAGYPSRRRNGAIELLHTLILGKREGLEIDHINGDKLDARRANLRHVTHAQNLQNRTTVNKRGNVRGVRFFKRDGTWRAEAHKNGRTVHIGYYATQDEAARAAREWRIVNMPGTVER